MNSNFFKTGMHEQVVNVDREFSVSYRSNVSGTGMKKTQEGLYMYPTLEKLKSIAQSGEYRRIPVCHELYSDRYTPVEVMRTLRTASRHCYLLESASQTEVWGRYSFLGYEPSMEITCTDGKLQI